MCDEQNDEIDSLNKRTEICSLLENTSLTSGFQMIFDRLKSCKNLKTIEILECNLNNERARYIGNTFTYCSQLKYVNLSRNCDTGVGFKLICNGLLKFCNTLTSINVSHCNLSIEQTKNLGEALKHCTQMENVDLSGNWNMGDGFEVMCNGLKSAAKLLKTINLAWCTLNNNQMKYLGKTLQHCYSLETLILSGNGEMEQGFKMICTGLKSSSTTLKSVIITLNNFNHGQIKFLGETFKLCSSLENVHLSLSTNVGNGFSMICNGLKSSAKALRVINLSCNYLNPEQSEYLGETFQNCTFLESIDLSQNRNMGDNGFKMICNGIKSSYESLRTIYLNRCGLNDQQASYLGEMFRQCTSLEYVDLSSNPNMDNIGFKVISYGLISSKITLKTIKLNSCSLNSTQAEYLGESFQQCSSLENVDINFNKTMEIGFKSICKGLKTSSNCLKTINVKMCDLNEEQTSYLGEAIQYCSFLENLDLYENRNMGNGFKMICDGLKSSSNSFKTINIGWCNLNNIQAGWLGETFEFCSSLENVDLTENSNMGNGFKTICNGFETSSYTLKSISVNRCNLNEEQAKPLGEALSLCSSLQNLNLNGNGNMKNGFKEICDGLKLTYKILKKMNARMLTLNDEQSRYLSNITEILL